MGPEDAVSSENGRPAWRRRSAECTIRREGKHGAFDGQWWFRRRRDLLVLGKQFLEVDTAGLGVVEALQRWQRVTLLWVGTGAPGSVSEMKNSTQCARGIDAGAREFYGPMSGWHLESEREKRTMRKYDNCDKSPMLTRTRLRRRGSKDKRPASRLGHSRRLTLGERHEPEIHCLESHKSEGQRLKHKAKPPQPHLYDSLGQNLNASINNSGKIIN